MAYDPMALADLAVFNKRDLADIDVRDLLDRAPLVQVLNAVPATNGNLHYYFKTTGAPVVGFRAANDGREEDSVVRTGVTVTLGILDASFSVDKAVADAYIRGPEALIQMEAMEHLRAAFFALEDQIINGTVGGDSGGFAGLANSTDHDNDNSTMVYNAQGTTACTSVWLIRSGMADVSVVAGNAGSIDFGETVIERLDGATGTYPAYYTPVSAWYGLQLGSIYSAARIGNIDAGSNTLTDDMLYEALALFPAGGDPTHIVMNRRSLKQLRDSRTATNATGSPAGRPTELEGIPIIVTDAIGSAETALTH